MSLLHKKSEEETFCVQLESLTLDNTVILLQSDISQYLQGIKARIIHESGILHYLKGEPSHLSIEQSATRFNVSGKYYFGPFRDVADILVHALNCYAPTAESRQERRIRVKIGPFSYVNSLKIDSLNATIENTELIFPLLGEAFLKMQEFVEIKDIIDISLNLEKLPEGVYTLDDFVIGGKKMTQLNYRDTSSDKTNPVLQIEKDRCHKYMKD